MENSIICIPSRNRHDFILKESGTWKYIKYSKLKVYLYIRNKELQNYEEALNKVGFKNVVIRTTDNNINIAEKRQLMLEDAILNNKKFLIMLDDDLTFYKRNEDTKSKYVSCKGLENELYYLVLESVRLCSKKYPLIGFPHKFGSQGRKYMYEKNVPLVHYACYYTEILEKENISFTGLNTPFGQDSYVQLCILQKGYRSLMVSKYAVGDKNLPRCVEEGGNSGGCHDYRTIKLKEESEKLLHGLCPRAMVPREHKGKIKYFRKYKVFLDKGELPYIPKEELDKWS